MNLAIIGAGVIGQRHIAAIAACSSARTVAVVDVESRASETADKADAAFFQSTEAMLSAVKPDGVIVCTPTIHHLEPALLALEAGCQVLVEKPVAATMQEATTLVAKSAQVGRRVLVGHQRRYYQRVHRARELVQGGALGQFVAVSGLWAVRKDDPYYSAEWRRQQPAGPILTNLIHEIDLLRFICGEIESVSAETSNLVRGFDKEDAAACVLRFSSGALGTFLISDQATSPWAWEFATGENDALPKSGENSLRFVGSEAALEFPNLVLWKNDGAAGNWNQPIHRESMNMAFEDAYIEQIEHFAAVFRDEAAPMVDAADGRRTLQATLALFESAASGQRVMLR